jgi:glycine cleavage system H lipoate-binding protein
MDFLASKGIEYLFVIGYLLLLIPFWMIFFGEKRARRRLAAAPRPEPVAAMRSWFEVPDGVGFHQGHTWAVPEGNGVFRVGMDDFAQRLLGPPKTLQLPLVGSVVEQGEPALRVAIDGKSVGVVSPVRGEVLETNSEALHKPGVVCEDPYGRGWLMRVKVPRSSAVAKGLLTGELARSWMDQTASRLDRLMGPSLGPVLQDGGVPVSGFARELSPDHWQEIAEELLLSK